MLNEQAKHIAYILGHAIDNDIGTIETTRAASPAWS
jgi:hypothetical protein